MPEGSASPVSALPSTAARLLAFLAIVVAGVCGGLIGYSVTEIQCRPEGTAMVVGERAGGDAAGRPGEDAAETSDEDDGGCPVLAGVGGVVGAGAAAGGTAVIAVLVLRAMGEWRQIEEDAAA